MSAIQVCQSSSPTTSHYLVTKKGGNLIGSIRGLMPQETLISIMTATVKVMVGVAASTDQHIQPQKDILVETFLSRKWKGNIFAKNLSKAAGVVEIELDEDFMKHLKLLEVFLRYESQEVAIRHVLVFAYYLFSYKRRPGLIH